MKLHRYYVGATDLTHEFWMKDEALFYQWTKVLRYKPGREVVLFNDEREVRLYKIEKIGNDAVYVTLITEMKANLPTRDIYLCFSILKKDKNDWVLQKATELGVSHFVPLLCDRTEKTGFDEFRAQKIVIEAAEQCERGDIPRIREPLSPQKLVEEMSGKTELFVAEQGKYPTINKFSSSQKSVAVLVGPEGGWSDDEKVYFTDNKLQHIQLSDFTLRAETAAITAAALLQ
jgi:16S rRNA (uracil1498-N3)-methyltransferase